MKKLIMSVLLVNLLAACASDKPKEVAPEPTAASTTTAPATEGTAAAATTEAAATPADELNDPNNAMLSKRSAFFPFDVDAVQAADKPMVQAHGQYLAKHADRKVTVEGNCDERGSSEYNLGLGNRRANNVKKMLVASGAKSAQVATVSFGEEKPRCAEHNESCWSQNRRADLSYGK
ncbi:MAG TPA: peptidoglycan-associated lipoprotein Pal [Gallionellaceae bacterium]